MSFGKIAQASIPSKALVAFYLFIADRQDEVNCIGIGGLVPQHGAFLVLVGEIGVAVNVGMEETGDFPSGLLGGGTKFIEFVRIDVVRCPGVPGIAIRILAMETVLDILARVDLGHSSTSPNRQNATALRRIFVQGLGKYSVEIRFPKLQQQALPLSNGTFQGCAPHRCAHVLVSPVAKYCRYHTFSELLGHFDGSPVSRSGGLPG